MRGSAWWIVMIQPEGANETRPRVVDILRHEGTTQSATMARARAALAVPGARSLAALVARPEPAGSKADAVVVNGYMFVGSKVDLAGRPFRCVLKMSGKELTYWNAIACLRSQLRPEGMTFVVAEPDQLRLLDEENAAGAEASA